MFGLNCDYVWNYGTFGIDTFWGSQFHFLFHSKEAYFSAIPNFALKKTQANFAVILWKYYKLHESNVDHKTYHYFSSTQSLETYTLGLHLENISRIRILKPLRSINIQKSQIKSQTYKIITFLRSCRIVFLLLCFKSIRKSSKLESHTINSKLVAQSLWKMPLQ